MHQLRQRDGKMVRKVSRLRRMEYSRGMRARLSATPKNVAGIEEFQKIYHSRTKPRRSHIKSLISSVYAFFNGNRRFDRVLGGGLVKGSVVLLSENRG